MKEEIILNVEQSSFIPVVQMAASVTSSSRGSFVSENLLDRIKLDLRGDTLTVSAIDHAMYYQGQVSCDSCNQDVLFTCLLPAKLAETVKSLNLEKGLTLRFNSKAVIEDGQSRVALGLQDSGSYLDTAFKVEEWDVECEVERITLVKALNYAHQASRRHSTSAVAEVFQSICIEIGAKKGITVWATDTHRIHVVSLEASLEASHEIKVLVPEAATKAILRFLKKSNEKIQININSQFIRFADSRQSLTVRLTQGELPDCRTLIAQIEPTGEVRVSLADLIHALQLASALFRSDEAKPTTLSFRKGGELAISASRKTDEVSTTISFDGGFELNIMVDAGYFLDALLGIDGDMVILRIQDRDTPFFICPKNNDGALAVIAPILDD